MASSPSGERAGVRGRMPLPQNLDRSGAAVDAEEVAVFDAVGRVATDRHDLGPRGHHLAHDLVAEPDD